MIRIGIVGAGLIGTKRAQYMKGATLVAVADVQPERAAQLAALHNAQAELQWQTLVQRPDIDAVLVCTSHDALSSCAVAALNAGKHVLVEKPGGRNPRDIELQMQAAERARKVLAVGFNHRFHPAFQRAKMLLLDKASGPLMYFRARYGHGGRPGYEKEWRANPALSGGGELLDQGVHLIDLCRWLGGEFDLEWGSTGSFFWNMPVEDNGFLFLRSPDQQRAAFLHASWTEWKNLFDFEIFTRYAKLEITGLGRSYGKEELRYYQMKPEMGPPDLRTESFEGEDLSWQREFDAFLGRIDGHVTDIATGSDAGAALRIVHATYAMKKEKAPLASRS